MEACAPGAVPADHGVWLDQDERVCPAGPDPGQEQPEGSIGWAQSRPWCGPAQGDKLLAEGEVVKGELGADAEHGRRVASRLRTKASMAGRRIIPCRSGRLYGFMR
jgi:hypothetical protein